VCVCVCVCLGGGGGYACVTDFTQSQMTLHNFIVRLMCKLGPTDSKDCFKLVMLVEAHLLQAMGLHKQHLPPVPCVGCLVKVF